MILFTATTVIITAGFPLSSARKTEVFNIADQAKCNDLHDLPTILNGPEGGTFNGIPTVCGGWSSGGAQNKCYQYRDSDNEWKEISTTMVDKRAYAASIKHDDKMHLFGGYNGQILDKSEFVDYEFSYPGPILPNPTWYHTITKVNQTTFILAGGITPNSSDTAKTWYYDNESQIFFKGPALKQGRRQHASCTIIDHITKEKIPVIAGGRYYDDGLFIVLDSIELLMNNQWIPGKIQL